MVALIILSSSITVLLVLYPLLKYLVGKQKFIVRLNRYTNIEIIREEKKKIARKDFKMGFGIVAKGIGSVQFLDGYKKSVRFQLTRAHILLKAEEFMSLCVITSAIAGFLTFLITGSMPLNSALLFSIAAAVGGFIIPNFVLNTKIKKRMKLLNDQLCDAIALISNSLKAGFSFFQAMDSVAKEMTGPIAEEFTLLQKEINLGLTTEKALENMVKRVCSDDLELVVTAVLIQRQVGGNLAEVLDSISSTIRERIKIKGEVKTLTAQGRISGLIISVLPPGLGFLLFIINPEHIGILFQSTLGIVIVVFSIFMELIGIFCISRIVKIEM